MMIPLLLQVASVLTLTSGEATTLVRNSSSERQEVTVALHHATQTGSQVTLGREVAVLVAPSTFTLAPRESQTIRIRLREQVPPGTVLRLVTTFTPNTSAEAPGSDTAPVARLVIQTRLITKVLVQ